MTVAVILPALNEEAAVEAVVLGFVAQGARVVVADNGSRDRTAEIAKKAGAEVVHELRRGYGSACLRGIEHLRVLPPDIVVFADCDGTLDPSDLPRLVGALDDADMALGRRAFVDKGAMPAHQKIGNDIACLGLRLMYGLQVRDMPPLRALRWSLVERLGLRERTFGLPVETLAVAARLGARIVEIDTHYLRRTEGTKSKVTGTWQGSTRAALVMGSLLVRLRFRRLA